MTDPSPAGDTPERSVDVLVVIETRVTGPFLADALDIAGRIALESLGFPAGTQWNRRYEPNPFPDADAYGHRWQVAGITAQPLSAWPTVGRRITWP